jgi:cathepsin L
MRCQVNWHGDVFSYLVDHGLPLGGATGYTEDKDVRTVWECDAPSTEKALTWDYVTTTPHLVPANEEIKKALILYGPLVATLTWEDCFTLYGGGIFNEAINKSNNDDLPHIVLIIGWDDSKKAWLVKNGYGTGWGEQGFGWVKYGSNNIGRNAAWVLADPEPKIEPMKREATGN